MEAPAKSEFLCLVEELRSAMADEWAHPLPCSRQAENNRARRVTLARLAVLHRMARFSA